MHQLPRYTIEQVGQIIEGLQALTVTGKPVFDVKVINAATNEPIALEGIQSSGMIYLKLDNGISVGNFAAWVEVPE